MYNTPRYAKIKVYVITYEDVKATTRLLYKTENSIELKINKILSKIKVLT